MKDKTLLGGIIVMAAGVLLIAVIWVFFLNPTVTPSATLQAEPVDLPQADSAYVLFEIEAAQSEITFQLDEVLRGLPTTALGRSQEMAGQIAVKFDEPEASQVGPILINARTFRTDNSFRDNAIHNFILQTETFEFITFTPIQIQGLPLLFDSGAAVPLQIEGDLTIREITQRVTFFAVVQPDTAKLTGQAEAEISRGDFDLEIPNAPGVAEVSDTVILRLDFIAYPVEQ